MDADRVLLLAPTRRDREATLELLKRAGNSDRLRLKASQSLSGGARESGRRHFYDRCGVH